MVTTHAAFRAFLVTFEGILAAGFRELRDVQPEMLTLKQRQAIVNQLRVMGNLFHQIADRMSGEQVTVVH